ncbi:MAG TPA: MFS transporter [Steroidobacteraceae bacterium]|jgi:MFS family permease|nr:MFS transporter [Steroidobacteraceae bacterium]
MEDRRQSKAYKYLVLGVLLLVYLLNYLDRQLVSLLAEPIKKDLALTDTQLGMVTGLAFAIFYTTFGVPVAWLADRKRRTAIVALACGLWSAFTAACGLARNFASLALARTGVGVGEAGGVPPSYSILSDYFPPARRGLAMGLYSLGIPLGTFAGGEYGVWATNHYGWRTAFYLLAIPGVALALLLPFLVREPRRGALDDAPPLQSAPLGKSISLFLRSGALVFVTLGCSLSAVVGYSLQSWSPAFLMRVQGATLADIGSWYAPLIGLSIAAGIAGSGALGDRFGRTGAHRYPLVPAIAFVLAFPLYLAALNAHGWRVSVLLLAIPQGLTFMYLAPAVAVIQNLVPAERRTTASALLLFVLNLFAVGCGPLYVGAVSDWARPQYGTESLRIALYALMPFFVLGVGCNLWASRLLRTPGDRRLQPGISP